MHDELAKGITVALHSVDARLGAMNEFRGSINDLIANTVSRDTWAAAHSQLEARIELVSVDLRDRLDAGLATANGHVERDLFDARAGAVDKEIKVLSDSLDLRLKALENWRSRAVGVGIVVVLFAGAAGAAIVKALGG